MKKVSKRALALLLTFVMVFACVPFAGTDFGAMFGTSVASAAHTHKKVTSVKKATLSKNGVKTVTCSTCKKVLSKTTIAKISSVKLSKTTLTYTGKALKPSVTVKNSSGKTLKSGTDYTVAYKNNKAAGKASATVTFKGNYSGTKTLSFTIIPSLTVKKTSSSLSLSWTKVTDAAKYKVSLYNGKSLVRSVTVKKTSAYFTKLSSLKSYRITVTASNKKGKSILSATYNVKTDSKAVSVQIGALLDTPLDPAFGSYVGSGNIALTLFEPLLIVDKNGKTRPGQAKSYSVSKDGLTWKLTMRSGLKWSDGSALNAKDFEYTFKRLADVELAAPYADTVLSMIDGYYDAIGAPDDNGRQTKTPNKNKLNVKASKDGKTLTIKLAYPCAYFDRIVAMFALCPVKKATVQKNQDGWAKKASTFVSNGPYTVEKLTSSSIVCKKNPYYSGGWDKDKIVAEKLRFIFDGNDYDGYSDYKNGRAQLVKDFPFDELEKYQRSKELKKDSILGTYYINMNLSKAPFNNKLVRKALSLAIDREYIANVLMNGMYTPAYNLIGSGVIDSSGLFLNNSKKLNNGKTYISTDYAANLKEAKEALKKAGYPDGKGLPTITYSTNDSGYHIAVAEYLKDAYLKIGVHLEIEEVDWSSFAAQRRAGEYEMARNGWIMDYNNASNMLTSFCSFSWNNDSGYNSKKFDAAMNKAASATTASAQSTALHNAEKILMNDYAVIPVAYYCDYWLQKPTLKGTWHSAEGYWYLQYAYIAA